MKNETCFILFIYFFNLLQQKKLQKAQCKNLNHCFYLTLAVPCSIELFESLSNFNIDLSVTSALNVDN